MDLNSIQAFSDKIDIIMKSNNKSRIKPIRDLLKEYLLFIYDNTDITTFQGLINLIFGTTTIDGLDLPTILGSDNILNHLNKGVKTKLLELATGDELSNYTSDTVSINLNDKTFEVKNNEILVIKEKVKINSSEYNYYRLWLFKKGTGIWGKSNNPDVSLCYESDFILINETLIGQSQINSIILGNNTIQNWLNFSSTYNVDSIITWLYYLQNNKADLVNGKIPLEQLPFTDDVLKFNTYSDFPTIGEIGIIYIDLQTDKIYIWDSSNGNYKVAGLDELWKNQVDLTLINKIDKPTTTGNTTSYPFVVGEDGNGNSARLPAGDLGKNFFNSDLSNTTARTHTMNAGVTVNTLGNPHTLSGLPNKNADITNFRKVRVQNASGLDSVVDSKNLLTDGVTSMTDAEKDAWRLAQRKTGENYSTGQPRIDYILPFIVKRETFIQYVSLIGLNLFVNPLNTVIKLVNIATLVEYDVANNTISVNAIDTGKLQFSLNFSTIPVGVYKIKLIHSNLQNIDPTTFEVVDNINSIPINCTWNSLKSTDSRFSHSTAITSPNSVYQKTPVTSGDISRDVITEVIKSSPILTAIQAAGNWVIQLKLMHNKNHGYWGGYRIGISNSNTGINLINDIMFGFYRHVSSHAIIPLNTAIGGVASLLNEDITIIKSGLNIKVFASFGAYRLYGISTLSSNFNSDLSLSLVMQGSDNTGNYYLNSDISVIIESIILS